MSSTQKKKVKFLEDQGGKVLDIGFVVVQKPDGSKALVDEFGRCEWVVTNEMQDYLTRKAIASEISLLSLTDGETDYSRAARVAMNCRGGLA